MGKIPLIGPSYSSQSVNSDCQITMNLYPEVIESGMGNNQIVLYPSPGTKLFVDLNPPPPPVPLPPNIYNTIALGSGINSGNTFTVNYVSGPAIKVGDKLFFRLNMQLVPNANLITGITVNYLGTDLGAFSEINVPILFSSGSTASALLMFYATAAIAVPAAATIQAVFTFAGAAANHSTEIHIDVIRNLTILDQSAIASFTAGTSFSAPAITTAEQEFVFSFIYPLLDGLSVTIPLPFLKYTDNVTGCSAAYRDTMIFQFIAPAGTFTPTYASNSGPQDAAILTASFKLATA